MSLINQMLQDLESRKNPQAEAIQKKPVYEDLKPLGKIPSRAPSRRLVMLMALIAVVGAGAYAWAQWGDSLVSSLFPEPAATKSAPVAARKTAVPKPAPAPAPQAVTAVAQAIEAKTSTPPPTPAEKPAESPVNVAQVQPAPPAAVAEHKKPEVTPAPAAAKKVAPAKSKTAVAKESGFWTVSRGETLYNISAQTGVDLWDLSNWNKLGREHVIHPGQRLRLTPPAKAETKKAKTEKAATPEKEKTAIASATTSGAQKAEPKTTPATSSVKESQTGNAVMAKKMKPLSSDEKSESEYQRAIDLLQKGHMADAEKHLKLALSANEAHTQTRELLAGLMLQQGHWREAQQLLEQGIGKVPAHYPFVQLLARVYVEHGADQKALTVMEASRRAAADNPDYVAFLAALYQRAGKHTEAVKTYNEAVALNPQEGRSWLGLGISLEAMQDRNAAATAYQRAIDSGTLDDKLLKYARQRLAVLK